MLLWSRFLIATTSVLLALAGCAPAPQPPLRVVSLVWPGYETLYLARSLGYYDKAPIRLVEMTSAGDVSHALRNGTVEAGMLVLDEALALMQDGVDLRVVLVLDVSNGADVLMARPGIADLRALRGKRIGLENAGNGALMLDAALEAGGLHAEDVRQVQLTLDGHLTAYRSGKVDALITFEPARSQLLKEGAHILFDSRSIPNRIVDVLVVRSEAMERHHEALKTLVDGHFRALDYLARKPQDAAMRMAPRLDIAPEAVLPQFAGMKLPDVAENRAFLAGTAPRLKSSADALVQLMLRRHLLQRPVAVDRLAEPAFLPDAAK